MLIMDTDLIKTIGKITPHTNIHMKTKIWTCICSNNLPMLVTDEQFDRVNKICKNNTGILYKICQMKKYIQWSRASLMAQWQRIHLPYRTQRRREFHPWFGEIPWRRKWQPIVVFLPGKFHGQGSLVGYSPKGRKKLGMTEWLSRSMQSSVSY